MNLQNILALLPKVGPIIAAAPEFKKLVDEIISTLKNERDQSELQRAYELAIDDAEEAHRHLQTIVARNS